MKWLLLSVNGVFIYFRRLTPLDCQTAVKVLIYRWITGHGSHVRSQRAALPCCQEWVCLARGAQPVCWSRCWKLKASRFMRSGGEARRKRAAWQRNLASHFTPADRTMSCCTKMSTSFASIFHLQWRGRSLSKHWVRVRLKHTHTCTKMNTVFTVT